eukprot:COSAG03_NODE_13092_length_517_cov_0.739234_1_plen_31_part_10
MTRMTNDERAHVRAVVPGGAAGENNRPLARR